MAAGCSIAEQLEDGRGDVGEDAAVAQPSPSAVTISGTGLSEWAVLGEPSGSSMLSALPWSAVTRQAPPDSCTARPRRRGSRRPLDRGTAAGMLPVWPTMSGLAKLMIPKR